MKIVNLKTEFQTNKKKIKENKKQKKFEQQAAG